MPKCCSSRTLPRRAGEPAYARLVHDLGLTAYWRRGADGARHLPRRGAAAILRFGPEGGGSMKRSWLLLGPFVVACGQDSEDRSGAPRPTPTDLAAPAQVSKPPAVVLPPADQAPHDPSPLPAPPPPPPPPRGLNGGPPGGGRRRGKWRGGRGEGGNGGTTVRLPVRRISSAVLSTTQPPLRMSGAAPAMPAIGPTRASSSAPGLA